METEYKLMLIAFVFMFLLGILATILFNYYTPGLMQGKMNMSKNMIENVSGVNISCDNLSLVNTSQCLNKELKTFFFYNLSNVGKELNDYDYKTLGMVCHQATEWYIQKFKELNDSFYTENVIIKTGDKTSHEIAIVSNEDSYCYLDQLSYNCYTLGI